MVATNRIGPDGAFVRDFVDVQKRVQSLETKPAGSIVIRDTLKTIDPATGVETIIGQLPDGSYGIQPFVGDTTPPPVPTVPLPSAQPGLITVGWDGLFSGGAVQPRDFVHVNVMGHKMSGATTVSTVKVGTIRLASGNTFVSTDVIPIDETWQFSLTSEDYNGNISVSSPRSATFTMESVTSDRKVTEALDALDAADRALDIRANTSQQAAADAQALADAILVKGANLAVNGDFDLPIVSPPTGWNSLILSSVVASVNARSGANVLQASPTASMAFAYSTDVTTAKDRIYAVEMWVRLAATAPDPAGAVQFRIRPMKLDGTTQVTTVPNLEGITASGLSTTAYTKVTAKYTVPVDSKTIAFGMQFTGNGNVYLVDSFKAIDITAAEAAQVKADQAFNASVQASSDSGDALTAANSKNRNWYQGTAPAGTSHKDGDVWFDTANDNRIYIWNASTNTWADFRDKAIAAASAAATGAKASADGKNKNYYQSTAPTDSPAGTLKANDLWFDIANGYRLSTWTGTAWQTTQDAALAKATAETKGRTYTQSVVPPVEARNDTNLWIDTSLGLNNTVTKYWNGTAWTPVTDKASTDAATTASAKGETIFSSTAPVAAKQLPQNLWIDTTGGINLPKRWDGAGWVNVTDKVATDAAALAGTKSKVLYQTTAPTGADASAGTLWIDTTGGANTPKRWVSGTTWAAVTDKVATDAAAALTQKPQSYAQATAPSATGRILGDTWIDTANSSKLYIWNGTAWIVAQDSAIQLAATTAANGKNKIVWSTSAASGTTGYSSGDTWFQTDGSGTVIAQWEFTTAWQTRKVGDAVIGNLDAGKIISGTIDAQRIGANSITADKLLVSDRTNFWENPGFEADTVGQAPIGFSIVGTGAKVIGTGASGSGKSLELEQATDVYGLNLFEVQPGDKFYVTAEGKYLNTAGTGTGRLGFRAYNAVKTHVAWSPVVLWSTKITAFNAPGGTGYTGVYTVPAGTYFLKTWVNYTTSGESTNRFQVDNIIMRRMNGGELIVDGSITSTSIAASAIDGKTITGATVQTEATANRGIKLTSSELAGYDGAGVKNLSLTSGGALTLKGAIQSGSTITGATLTGAGIETSATAARGVKLASTGITTYDGAGNMTFKVDAATGLVEAPGLKANSITGDKIASDTILAESLVISDLGNYATINELTGQTVTSYGQTEIVNGYNQLVIDSGSYFFFTNRRGPNPFQVGDELFFEFTAKATAPTTASFALYTYDAASSNTAVSVTTTTIGTTDTPISGILQINAIKANAVTFVLGLQSVNNKGIKVKNVRVYKRFGGSLIVDGAITSNSIATAGLDAGVIKSGYIDSNRIDAGTITTDKLVTGIGSNLIPDPNFENPNITALRNVNSNMTVAKNATTGTLDLTMPGTGNYYFRPTGIAQSSAAYRNWIPVTPGEKYLYTANVTNGTGGSGDIRITGRKQDGVAGSSTFSVTGQIFPTFGAGTYPNTYEFTVPSDAYWMLPEIRFAGFTGTVSIAPGSISLHRQTGGKLIAIGGIETNHIISSGIDASAITAGTISSTQIGSKAINADRLVISSTDNLVVESDFGNGGSSWGTGTFRYVVAGAGRVTGSAAMRFTGTTSTNTSINLANKFTVDSDNRYRGSIWVKTTVALASDKVRLWIRCYTTTTTFTDIKILNNSSVSTATNYLPTGAWTQLKGISPALPANTIAAEIYLSVAAPTTATQVDMDAVSVTRAADGTLIVDGAVTASSLETNMVLATTIIAGDANGTHAEMAPTGFKVFAQPPAGAGGSPTEVLRLGVAASNDYFAITKASGDIVAAISEAGAATFSQVNVPAYNSGTASGGLWYDGNELAAILDGIPRGPLYKAELSKDVAGITTKYGLIEAQFVVKGDRQIAIDAGIWTQGVSPAPELYAEIRYTTDGTAPTINSTLLGFFPLGFVSATTWDSRKIHHTIRPYTFSPGSEGKTIRLLLTVTAGNSSLHVRAGLNTYLYLSDVGKGIPHTPSFTPGGGVIAAPPTAVPAVNTYVKQYVSNNSQSYTGTGAVYSSGNSYVYQGLSPAGVGNLKSIATFPSMTGDLSGASINYIRVYYNFLHWYNNSGGTARIGLHAQSTPPATYTGNLGVVVTSTGWPKPGARWIDIPSQHWDNFKTGAYKGVYLEGDSTYTTYGYADRPIIEISYNK